MRVPLAVGCLVVGDIGLVLVVLHHAMKFRFGVLEVFQVQVDLLVDQRGEGRLGLAGGVRWSGYFFLAVGHRELLLVVFIDVFVILHFFLRKD